MNVYLRLLKMSVELLWVCGQSYIHVNPIFLYSQDRLVLWLGWCLINFIVQMNNTIFAPDYIWISKNLYCIFVCCVNDDKGESMKTCTFWCFVANHIHFWRSIITSLDCDLLWEPCQLFFSAMVLWLYGNMSFMIKLSHKIVAQSFTKLLFFNLLSCGKNNSPHPHPPHK